MLIAHEPARVLVPLVAPVNTPPVLGMTVAPAHPPAIAVAVAVGVGTVAVGVTPVAVGVIVGVVVGPVLVGVGVAVAVRVGVGVAVGPGVAVAEGRTIVTGTWVTLLFSTNSAIRLKGSTVTRSV